MTGLGMAGKRPERRATREFDPAPCRAKPKRRDREPLATFLSSTPGHSWCMAEIQEKGRRFGRVVGRGRDERTPLYLLIAVVTVIGVVVGVVVGLVFLAQALA